MPTFILPSHPASTIDQLFFEANPSRRFRARAYFHGEIAANPNVAYFLDDGDGTLTIEEVRQLKPRSKTGFYSDLKAGLVSIQKIGRKSVVPGAVAARYIAGEPINPPSTASAD